MGAKASRTEKHILAKAREIFSKKGFKNVTMQDIVDACDISRGGLYLHFSSVEDIFLAVLKAEEIPNLVAEGKYDAAINNAIPSHCQSDMLSPMNSIPAIQGTISPAVAKAVTITMVPLCIASSIHSCASTSVAPDTAAIASMPPSNCSGAGSKHSAIPPSRKEIANRHAIYCT